jgi:hypothetical protein
MLIYKEDNPSMKAVRAEPLSDYQDRFVYESIPRRQPQESGFVRRDPPKTG